ncbi:MAG TPA: MFS transporter [Candidatus Acidoferrum sp.]
MEELTPKQQIIGGSAEISHFAFPLARLTPVQWLVCGVAALGFAFDLYETLVLPLIVRPALAALGNLKPGSPESNHWVGLLFFLPLASGGVFGLLGGYLTDLLGRRRVLVWSILLYACSACAASFALTLPQLLFFRCTTIIGVCVEFVAGVAWVAELFSNPKQRESVLGYTQAAVGFGGLMVTGAYYVAVTYAERFPAIHGGHEAWRYTLLSGLIPAIPLILVRPFLPESPIWREKKSNGTLKRPSIVELFRPALRKTTLVSTFLVACSYALASGVILQTPRMVPGLPEVRGLAPRLVEQTVSRVQLFQEVGTIAGRLLFAFLVIRIATQRRLLRVFLIPGLIVFVCVYFFAATHSLRMLEYGILLAGLLLNGPFSLWGNYLPRMYPTHLRGTGESFAINIGARVIGASGVLFTTQLANVMPGISNAAKLAYSAGTLAVLAYAMSLVGSFWLREPEHAQLPD